MKAEIIAKKGATRRKIDDLQNLALQQPSVIVLKLAPESVARYERRGDDLVLVLKDGQEVVIHAFFVQYPAQDHPAAESTPAPAASDHGSSSGQDNSAHPGRNDLVLEDNNGVTWWGQYPDQWTEFHFTEIESHDVAFPWWPMLLGGVLAGAAAGGGGGGIPISRLWQRTIKPQEQRTVALLWAMCFSTTTIQKGTH